MVEQYEWPHEENLNKLNLKKQDLSNPSFSFQNTVNLHQLNLPQNTMPSASDTNDVDEYLQSEMLNSIVQQCKSATGEVLP